MTENEQKEQDIVVAATDLSDERRRGKIAAASAFASAAAFFGGLLLSQSGLKDAPIGNRPDYLRFLAEHKSAVISSGCVIALGFILLAPVVYHLYFATRLRKPDLLRVILFLGVGGSVVFGIFSALSSILLANGALDYNQQSTQTIAGATSVLAATNSSDATTVRVFLQVGQVALVLWMMMGSLYAMRVGLLTRPIGYLGIILGASTLLQMPFAPILTVFWIGALGALFLGYWPGGLPKAWTTGQAEPWPSARDRSEAAAAAKRGAGST